MAAMLLKGAMDTSPTPSFAQALARGLSGLMGGLELRAANEADRAYYTALADNPVLRAGTTPPAVSTAPPVPPVSSAPTTKPAVPPDTSVTLPGQEPVPEIYPPPPRRGLGDIKNLSSPVSSFTDEPNPQASPLDTAPYPAGPVGAPPAAPTSGFGNVNVPAQYRDLITRSAEAKNLPPQLLAQLLRQESGFNPRVVSSAGAQGIAQLMPPTARGLGVRDPFDPEQAIPAAAQYLAEGRDRYGGDLYRAAQYYHGGPNTGMWGPKTRAYADIVTRGIATPPAGGGATALSGPPVEPEGIQAINAALSLAPANQPVGATATPPQPQGTQLAQATQAAPPSAARPASLVDAPDQAALKRVPPEIRTYADKLIAAGRQSGDVRLLQEAQRVLQPYMTPTEWTKFNDRLIMDKTGRFALAPNIAPDFTHQSELRKEIGGLPEVKRYSEASTHFRGMNRAGDTAAGDIAFVYGIAKIFDPDSVVREGEMKLAAGAQSIPEQIQGWMRKAVMGEGRLTPEQRGAIIDVSRQRMEELQGAYQGRVEPYRGLAQRNQINPEDILPVLPELPALPSPRPTLNTPLPAPTGRQSAPQGLLDPNSFTYGAPTVRPGGSYTWTAGGGLR